MYFFQLLDVFFKLISPPPTSPHLSFPLFKILFHLESFFSAYISELLNQIHLVEIFRHTGLVKNCDISDKAINYINSKYFSFFKIVSPNLVAGFKNTMSSAQFGWSPSPPSSPSSTRWFLPLLTCGRRRQAGTPPRWEMVMKRSCWEVERDAPRQLLISTIYSYAVQHLWRRCCCVESLPKRLMSGSDFLWVLEYYFSANRVPIFGLPILCRFSC